jgi:hypothetical protein
MAQYLRTIKVPAIEADAVIKKLALTQKQFEIQHAKDGNQLVAIIIFRSEKPVVIIPKAVVAERNATADSIIASITKRSQATNYGHIEIDLSEADRTASGAYDVTVLLRDLHGVSDEQTMTLYVVDTLAPIITAIDKLVPYGDIAAWEPVVTVFDNIHDDISNEVVITYFESDGTTEIDSLELFRTHLDNTGAGDAIGKVHFYVEDEDNNSAEKVVTITSKPRPVITADDVLDIMYDDITAWTPSVTALDGDEEDASGDVVVTYFQTNGSTAINNLADFRTYLQAAGIGDAEGKVKFNLTDTDGSEAVEVVTTVTSALRPVITAEDDLDILYGALAAWEPTFSALDSDEADASEDVVVTYFEGDGIEPITDLAAFRTHLQNDGLGSATGVVKLNLSHAAEVVITVTSAHRPVITATDVPELAYGDIATWDNDTMSAIGSDGLDATGQVTITYFEADGTTSIASLAEFRTYLDNDGSGVATGKVNYNLTDAVEVIITVTSGSNPG